MNVHVYRVSAFAYNNQGGNPAAIVLDADYLRDKEMLHIAKEVGYSETAFVMKSSKADFKIRFFTAVAEVDLCGHATIATFNLLRDLGVIASGSYTQETQAGILKLRVTENCVYMEQALPVFGKSILKKELSNCFDINEEDFLDDLPVQIVSTGLRDILLPIKKLDTLTYMMPNYPNIKQLSEKYNVVGIHAFSLESIGKAHAHCRNFAPRYGINEESATGTSNGGLACYLTKYIGNNHQEGRFEFEQGYSMGLPSRIYAKIIKNDGVISEVYVGGEAIKI